MGEIPIPDPGPGELLLRVETVGICGSDLAEYDHGPVLTPLKERHPVTGHQGPIVLGHEFSGTVERSRSDDFQPGELVACAAAVSCGTCRYCVSGRMSLCDGYWAVGLHRNGGLAEYCAVPASTCIRADGLTADTAALTQPMAIAVHATQRSRLGDDETAVVIGVGGVGAFITYLAAAGGARVVACDVDPDRLVAAQQLGASQIVHIESTTDLARHLSSSGIAPDVVLEVTGTNKGLMTAQDILVAGTRLIAVGIQKEPVNVDFRQLTLGEHEIIGTNALDMQSDVRTAVQALSEGSEAWTVVAPTVAPLEQLVREGLRVRDVPPPIKTLASPRIDSVRTTEIT